MTKEQILALTGLDENQFYQMYPDQESFCADFPDACAQIQQAKYGGIHINPANKGKFTASASRAGMGVQEFARHVLANKEDYSSTQVKRANFARNASKWKHEDGGESLETGGNVFPAMKTNYKTGGYYGYNGKWHPNSGTANTYVPGGGYYFQPGGGVISDNTSVYQPRYISNNQMVRNILSSNAYTPDDLYDHTGYDIAKYLDMYMGRRDEMLGSIGDIIQNDRKRNIPETDILKRIQSHVLKTYVPYNKKYGGSYFDVGGQTDVYGRPLERDGKNYDTFGSEQQNWEGAPTADPNAPQNDNSNQFDPNNYTSKVNPYTGFREYTKKGSTEPYTNIKKQDEELWGSLKDKGHGARWQTGQTDIQRFARNAGAIGNALSYTADIADMAGNFISNNQKQASMNTAAMNMGSTAGLYTNPMGASKGDYGVSGSAYGAFRPNKSSNMSYKGMYGKYGMEVPKYAVGGFEPSFDMPMSDSSLYNDPRADVPIREINNLYQLPSITRVPSDNTRVVTPTSSAITNNGKGNPMAYKTFEDINSMFKGVKNLGVWGDEKHKARVSDHNTGNALDIGITDVEQGNKITEMLKNQYKDRNVKYIIFNNKIWNPSVSNEWRNYNGSNPHKGHVHISFNPVSSKQTSYSAESLGDKPFVHNNPLSIHYGDFAKNYGGIKGEKDAQGYLTKFPDLNSGIEAAKDLLFGSSYNNLTISQARNKWVTGNPNNFVKSAKDIIKEMGHDKKINQLSPSEKDKLLKLFSKFEGPKGYSAIKDMKLFENGGQQLGGQVLEMDEDEIQQFLANGGQLEFLD